jgi:hypothetical protein
MQFFGERHFYSSSLFSTEDRPKASKIWSELGYGKPLYDSETQNRMPSDSNDVERGTSAGIFGSAELKRKEIL